MSTYLLPMSDGYDCWIMSVVARGITHAQEQFVKIFADDYTFIDYGATFKEAVEALTDHDFIVGEIEDIEYYQ